MMNPFPLSREKNGFIRFFQRLFVDVRMGWVVSERPTAGCRR